MTDNNKPTIYLKYAKQLSRLQTRISATLKECYFVDLEVPDKAVFSKYPHLLRFIGEDESIVFDNKGKRFYIISLSDAIRCNLYLTA